MPSTSLRMEKLRLGASNHSSDTQAGRAIAVHLSERRSPGLPVHKLHATSWRGFPAPQPTGTSRFIRAAPESAWQASLLRITSHVCLLTAGLSC